MSPNSVLANSASQAIDQTPSPGCGVHRPPVVGSNDGNSNDDDEQSPGVVSGGDEDTGGNNDDHQYSQRNSGN